MKLTFCVNWPKVKSRLFVLIILRFIFYKPHSNVNHLALLFVCFGDVVGGFGGLYIKPPSS